MTDRLLHRSFHAVAALLVATIVAACGGGNDTPAAPNGFQGNVSSAVPLVAAPRVAASPDGATWLAWVEGDNTHQTLIGARVDSVGVITKLPVTSNVDGALRDVQVTVVGTTPIVTWRQYAASGSVTVAAASFQGFAWFAEFASPASAQGDVRPLPILAGEVSLQWTRTDASGRFELVAARRSPFGLWSAPKVIRSGDPGAVLLRSSQSSDGSGGLMALWSEQPSGVAGSPETLLSSQYDETAATWRAPLTVDVGSSYGSPAVGSTGTSAWVAVWLAGNAVARTAVVGKRFSGGVWSAATDRIDQGQDASISELVLAPRNFHVHAGWIGVAAAAGSGNVRAASFDVAGSAWTAPSRVGSAANGVPLGLALRTDGQGTVAAAWSVSQGIGGLQLAVTDPAGVWQGASQVDPNGVAPDLAFFAATDLVTTWYRPVAGGLDDVAVRRTR